MSSIAPYAAELEMLDAEVDLLLGGRQLAAQRDAAAAAAVASSSSHHQPQGGRTSMEYGLEPDRSNDMATPPDLIDSTDAAILGFDVPLHSARGGARQATAAHTTAAVAPLLDSPQQMAVAGSAPVPTALTPSSMSGAYETPEPLVSSSNRTPEAMAPEGGVIAPGALRTHDARITPVDADPMNSYSSASAALPLGTSAAQPSETPPPPPVEESLQNAPREELLSHIVLQRTLIRNLYTKVITSERQLAEAMQLLHANGLGMNENGAMPTAEAGDVATRGQSKPDADGLHQDGTPEPVKTTREADAKGDYLPQLRRMLLTTESALRDPSLTAATIEELEATRKQLVDAIASCEKAPSGATELETALKQDAERNAVVNRDLAVSSLDDLRDGAMTRYYGHAAAPVRSPRAVPSNAPPARSGDQSPAMLAASFSMGPPNDIVSASVPHAMQMSNSREFLRGLSPTTSAWERPTSEDAAFYAAGGGIGGSSRGTSGLPQSSRGGTPLYAQSPIMPAEASQFPVPASHGASGGETPQRRQASMYSAPPVQSSPMLRSTTRTSPRSPRTRNESTPVRTRASHQAQRDGVDVGGSSPRPATVGTHHVPASLVQRLQEKNQKRQAQMVSQYPTRRGSPSGNSRAAMQPSGFTPRRGPSNDGQMTELQRLAASPPIEESPTPHGRVGTRRGPVSSGAGRSSRLTPSPTARRISAQRRQRVN